MKSRKSLHRNSLITYCMADLGGEKSESEENVEVVNTVAVEEGAVTLYSNRQSW